MNGYTSLYVCVCACVYVCEVRERLLGAGSPLRRIDTGSVTLCIPGSLTNLPTSVGVLELQARAAGSAELFLWVLCIPFNPSKDFQDPHHCCVWSGAFPHLLLIPWVDGASCTPEKKAASYTKLMVILFSI